VPAEPGEMTGKLAVNGPKKGWFGVEKGRFGAVLRTKIAKIEADFEKIC
jgi:hypothetical protein